MIILCSGFEISIEEYEGVTGSGPLVVDIMGQKGYMCAEGFDDKDAMVACRQLGYKGGYAYKYGLLSNCTLTHCPDF